ncbi:uncharacterized protein HMPREF1541_07088 [Cyphellophora europaea CBS 101466]|uniref:Xylanolytic transcriptional activator regulatory domain-containing protein n=1 Tax=Cyphellophora europaea (strain CBS 101466) TaxID=1220924 RepID=W2RLT5_CYPE1|nr:uncharacterized protein HMPREF1541_07088 [Cyphellophora europaea CBS 101466]ETN37466.1 hypothetical protein HMPREF1541_07088 [Cyphellophora europaea CBS 101466]
MLRHVRTHHKGESPGEGLTNPDTSDVDRQGTRAPPLLPTWTDSNSAISSQQPSRISQHQGRFNPDLAAPQSFVGESRGDSFAQGHNMRFQQGAACSLPGPDHTQSNILPLTPPLESAQAAASQFAPQFAFPARGFDAFNDEVDPMSWLLQADYNLNSFNDLIFGFNNDQVDMSQLNNGNPRISFASELHPPQTRADRSQRKVPDLRHCWYTQVSATDGLHGTASRSMSPAPSDDQSKDNIDENYRVSAASKLRPEPRTEPLPPIDLLNLFIHLFFTRFNVILPLIHGPTFQPTSENALLVLSICSAGSLWFGSQEATNAGSMLFERVNKAILESPWEKYILKDSRDSLNKLKASVIGQTFGLLAGNPVHLETAGGYHGTVISAARRMKFFDDKSELPVDENIPASQLNKVWRAWARSEERKRMAVSLYIHDAEIADLFHHEPFLRHSSSRLPPLSSTELFNAPSAETWYTRLKAEREESANFNANTQGSGSLHGQNGSGDLDVRLSRPIASPSMVEIYSTLSGIGASIAASHRLNSLTVESQAQYEAELLAWYDETAKMSHKWALPESGTSQLTLNVLALWHYTWMALNVDLNILELAVGREGSVVSESTIDYVDAWVRSDESLRCLLHAWLLQDCMVRMPAGPVVALHVPRILFSAAVVWHCYILYRPKPLPATSRNLSIDSSRLGYILALPEVQMMAREREQSPSWAVAWSGATGSRLIHDNIARLQDTLGSILTQIKRQTLYTLADILRRSASYGIASRMADIVEAFLSHGMDGVNDSS